MYVSEMDTVNFVGTLEHVQMYWEIKVLGNMLDKCIGNGPNWEGIRD